jgi:hypothetical protein
LWFRLRDDEDRTPGGREALAGSLHLAEVDVARDSGQMAEEDEEEKLAVEESRKANRRPVGPEQRQIGGEITRRHLMTLPRRNVTGARSRSRPLPFGRGTG